MTNRVRTMVADCPCNCGCDPDGDFHFDGSAGCMCVQQGCDCVIDEPGKPVMVDVPLCESQDPETGVLCSLTAGHKRRHGVLILWEED